MRKTALLVPLVLIVAGALLLIGSLSFSQGGHVNVIVVDGSINPGSADYISQAIDVSVSDGAEALVIELDTPGGLVDSTRTIVQAILNAGLPVIVYVSPSGGHAGSAGVMITLAANIAAMAPGTNIGAAHPVMGGGQEIDENLQKKITNDTAAFVETIANRRQRNTDWAIKAVRDSVSITEEKALKLKVIDMIAIDINELLEKSHGREVEVMGEKRKLELKDVQVVELKTGMKHRILMTLADPNLAYILMIIGALGLYIEFSHPGLIFPGVIGAMAIILFLLSIQTLPINSAGLLLIGLGLILFVVEIKVTSYGLLTIGGLVCLTLGSLFLFDVPEQIFDYKTFQLRVAWGLILPSVATLGAFVLFVAYVVLRAQRKKPYTGEEGLLGATGKATSDFADGEGKIFVHGEYWRAVSDEPISKGDKIEVVESRNLDLKVKKA